MIFKFNLKDEVLDLLTEFKGTITARTEWVNGCVRYNVQPKVGKDGKLPEAVSIDEADLKCTKAAQAATVKPAGGPRNDPKSPVGR